MLDIAKSSELLTDLIFNQCLKNTFFFEDSEINECRKKDKIVKVKLILSLTGKSLLVKVKEMVIVRLNLKVQGKIKSRDKLGGGGKRKFQSGDKVDSDGGDKVESGDGGKVKGKDDENRGGKV